MTLSLRSAWACGFVLLVLSSSPIAAQGSTEADLLKQLGQRSTAFGASLDLAVLYRSQGRIDDAVRMLEGALSMLRSEPRAGPRITPPPPPPPPGSTVHVGGDIAAPRKTRNVEPIYPESARAAGLSGAVVVEFLIDTTGQVGRIRVLRSSPPFDAAAVEAVTQWRYQPTLLNGVPVQVITTAIVRFSP